MKRTPDILTTSREFAKSSRCTTSVTVVGPFDMRRAVPTALLHRIYSGVKNQFCRGKPAWRLFLSSQAQPPNNLVGRACKVKVPLHLDKEDPTCGAIVRSNHLFIPPKAVMIPRSSLLRAAQRVFGPQTSKKPSGCRRLASSKSPGFSFETGEINGIKFASRDLPGPTTQLAVVARAGTRFQLFPGFAEGLEKFAFKVSGLY